MASVSFASTHFLSYPSPPSTNLSSYPNSVFFKPLNYSPRILTTKSLSSYRSSQDITPKLGRRFCIASLESGFPSEETIDIQLPRRSLLLKFKCNSCGETTQRLINRLAYERGTVFVQCAGCLQHHKLVDNLGLVVEYDYREDADTDSSNDQG